jgi:hypothetical protein
MAKASFHIGNKIKEVLDKTPTSVVAFAKSINLTRNGAYKVFEKETIDTGQLQAISKVLKHDFFAYYAQNLSITIKEIKTDYNYATKTEIENLTQVMLRLSKAVERIEEQLPSSRAQATKKSAVKKKPVKK